MVLSRSTQTHIVIGNINLDISLSVPSYPDPDGIVYASDVWIGPGGAAANYSIAIARLGHRAVLYARASKTLERLGLIELIKSEGVDVSGIIIDSSIETRVVVILNVPVDSSRTLIKSPPIEPIMPDSIPSDASNVHLATVHPSLLIELREQKGYHGVISYDPGGTVARAPSMVIETLKLVNVIFMNNVEIKILEKLTGVNPLDGVLEDAIIVVKHGDGGASVYKGHNLVVRASPPVVNVVDVTGAGDAFDAAFMAHYLDQGDVIHALRYAVAAGSAKVRHRGSSIMPSIKEIEDLVDKVSITVYSA